MIGTSMNAPRGRQPCLDRCRRRGERSDVVEQEQKPIVPAGRRERLDERLERLGYAAIQDDAEARAAALAWEERELAVMRTLTACAVAIVLAVTLLGGGWAPAWGAAISVGLLIVVGLIASADGVRCMSVAVIARRQNQTPS